MINKKLMIAVLILLVGMSVKAEPAANPAHDPAAQAPVVQGISHEGKSKVIRKENKKVEKTTKATGSTKAPEPKAGETTPSVDANKKTN